MNNGMKISELREFLNKIPETMDDYQVIYRRFEDEGDALIFLDYPITSLYLDEDTQEAALLDEDGWTYFSNNLLIHDDEDDIPEE